MSSKVRKPMPSDLDNQNPYASPSAPGAVEQSPLSRLNALRQLRHPAIGLVVSSSANLLWILVTYATNFVIVSTNLRRALRWDEWVSIIGVTLFLAFIAFLQVVILIGSVRLIRGQMGRWTWAASIAGLVPLGSPCVCLSMVFSIWLIVLLCRKDTRAAMACTNEASDSHASPG